VPSTTPDSDDDASPAKLLERLRKMERTIENLNDRNQQLQDKYDQLSKDVEKSKVTVQSPSWHQ
jgi:TolA-binding protein